MNNPCPTCRHMHPMGAMAGFCGCHDCYLLWQTTVRYEHMAPEFQERLRELRRMQEARDD